MRTYVCMACGYSEMAESFSVLREDGWGTRRVPLSTPGKLVDSMATLRFCGPDCRESVLEDMGIYEGAVSAAAERAMRGNS
jgi:hypothetical protein